MSGKIEYLPPNPRIYDLADIMSLHDLIGSVASSIVDAQGLVERHFIDRISHYFDSEGRPLSMAIKMPRPSKAAADDHHYMQLAVPLLSLVESSMLSIRDLTIELEVELGAVVDNPAAAPQSAATLAPSSVATRFPSSGAPIDVPLPGRAAPPPSPAPPPAALTASAPPEKMLTLGVGARQDSAPRAKLTINVTAQPPSEGMLRLLTQLNKLV